VPVGPRPAEQIGLNVSGALAGAMYIDQVQIGQRLYDFEDGTLQGWEATSGALVSSSRAVPFAGRWSLKVTPTGSTSGFQVRLAGGGVRTPIPAGTQITARVYVDAPGTAYRQSTLAAAIAKSERLNKPLVVGEAGMWVCESPPREQLETPSSRAARFDAKLEAFFRSGGAGYLVWAWHPRESCATDFSPGDPLNAVLAAHAAALRRR
jgi:hypothetical protein